MRLSLGRMAGWLAGAGLVLGTATALSMPSTHAATTGFAASQRPVLLLIHGYTDSCAAAFGPPSNSNPPQGTTTNYLTTNPQTTGNNRQWPADNVKTVGYYLHDEGTGDGGDNATGICDVDLNTSGANLGTGKATCDQDYPAGPQGFGSIDDPIMHLGCLFAWYIYNNYTTKGVPVEILSHSMGGLVARTAIGGYAADHGGFPPAPLLVPDVVSVAAPEQGIDLVVRAAAHATGQDGVEVQDMFPGSNFLTAMNETVNGVQPYEKPQGQGGTHWALIGSSVPSGPPSATAFQDVSCPPTQLSVGWTLAGDLSCLAEGLDPTQTTPLPYPDGDGVVLAESQMGMQADVKVLYGAVEFFGPLLSNPPGQLYVADVNTEYEHEANICVPLGSIPVVADPAIGTVCSTGPFYLNDTTSATTDTKAFVCSASCNATTDFSDLPIRPGGATPVPHSLAEIASQLVPPVTPASQSTYNMPATTEAGGAEYMAYADTSAAGAVNVAMYTPDLNYVASWSDPASSTFIGTGPTVAASQGGVVVTWADNGTSTDSSGVQAQQGDLMVALLRPSGFACVTDLRTAVQGNGTPAGITPYTPNVSSEGLDGTGKIFLTWVDTQNHNMHITPLIVNATSSSSPCAPFTVAPGTTVDVTNNTSFDGPALAISGYTGTSGSSGERFWLMWAGNDPGRHINIAEYQPTVGPNGFGLAFITQSTESTHATDNDIGGAFEPTPGAADGGGTEWMSYCGTDNQVYYQEFTSVAGGAEVAAGQPCTVTVTNGWYSGGTGISYQYSTGLMLLSWAVPSSLQVQLGIL